MLSTVSWLSSRHNLTTPNRAGNDVGKQYRSGIYYHKKEQKQVPPSLFLSVDLGSTQTLASQPVVQFVRFDALDVISMVMSGCSICHFNDSSV